MTDQTEIAELTSKIGTTAIIQGALTMTPGESPLSDDDYRGTDNIPDMVVCFDDVFGYMIELHRKVMWNRLRKMFPAGEPIGKRERVRKPSVGELATLVVSFLAEMDEDKSGWEPLFDLPPGDRFPEMARREAWEQIAGDGSDVRQFALLTGS